MLYVLTVFTFFFAYAGHLTVTGQNTQIVIVTKHPEFDKLFVRTHAEHKIAM